eukprot:2228005-Pyramimonas_sp.AAC.1
MPVTSEQFEKEPPPRPRRRGRLALRRMAETSLTDNSRGDSVCATSRKLPRAILTALGPLQQQTRYGGAALPRPLPL